MPSADQRIGLPQKPLASSFKLQVAFVCVQTLQTSGPGMKHMSALVSKRWKKFTGHHADSRVHHAEITGFSRSMFWMRVCSPTGLFSPCKPSSVQTPHEALYNSRPLSYNELGIYSVQNILPCLWRLESSALPHVPNRIHATSLSLPSTHQTATRQQKLISSQHPSKDPLLPRESPVKDSRGNTNTPAAKP